MGIETALIAAGLASAASTIYGSKKAKEQQKEAEAAAERTRLASATVQAVDAPTTVTADQSAVSAEVDANSKKKRRFSVSNTVNNASMLGAMTGKKTLG